MINGVNHLRDKAIQIAQAQFRSTGDVSMRKVGEAVGVTATALYHHFANKQALLDDVADNAYTAFETRLTSTTETDPVQIIRDILDAYRQLAKEEPNLFRLMFVDPHPAANKFPADFEAHRSPVFDLLWKAMADWMAGAEESENVAATDEAFYAAHDLWALAHGLIVLSHAGRFSDDRNFRVAYERSIDAFLARL